MSNHELHEHPNASGEPAPPPRPVRPHTPGPGYICEACGQSHRPGCNAETRDSCSQYVKVLDASRSSGTSEAGQ